MRGNLLWCGLVLAACGPGCSPLANVARTTITEPAQYPRRLDCAVSHLRYKQLADLAWDNYIGPNPEGTPTRDLARGFKAGYADYLAAGGKGTPPPLPPRWYWRVENQTPEGKQAIQDWYVGFRIGAAEAKKSGYRNLVVIPSSTSLLISQEGSLPPVPVPKPAPPNAELLPVPQSLPLGALPAEVPPAVPEVKEKALQAIPDDGL